MHCAGSNSRRQLFHVHPTPAVRGRPPRAVLLNRLVRRLEAHVENLHGLWIRRMEEDEDRPVASVRRGQMHVQVQCTRAAELDALHGQQTTARADGRMDRPQARVRDALPVLVPCEPQPSGDGPPCGPYPARRCWNSESKGRNMSELTDFCDRIRTVADESFGPFPNQTATEAMDKIEAGIFEQRRAIAVALAALERLRDCDWVISLPDRMDAVRTIAADAISAIHSSNIRGESLPPQGEPK